MPFTSTVFQGDCHLAQVKSHIKVWSVIGDHSNKVAAEREIKDCISLKASGEQLLWLTTRLPLNVIY